MEKLSKRKKAYLQHFSLTPKEEDSISKEYRRIAGLLSKERDSINIPKEKKEEADRKLRKMMETQKKKKPVPW